MWRIFAGLIIFLGFCQAPAGAGPAGTAENEVLAAVERLKSCYDMGQAECVASFFSDRLIDRGAWIDAVNRDLHGLRDIRTFYRVDRQSWDGDSLAVWDIYWERKSLDREGKELTSSGRLSVRFEKEGERWLVTGITQGA